MVVLQQVLCLEEVVRARSFRAAAQLLHMSQPAVSGHIARLERELHLTLLERTPSGSVLTAAGAQILPHLRAFAESADVIRQASEFIQHKQQHRAHHRVTLLSNSHGVHRMYPEIIAMLHRRFEQLTVRCGHADDDPIFDALRSGEADLGIVVRDPDLRMRAEIATSELLSIGPVGICARADDPLLRSIEGPLDAAVLEGQPLILLSHARSMQIADRLFPVSMRGAVTIVDDPQTATQMVEAGLGYALISGGTNALRRPHLDWRGLQGSPCASLLLARSRHTELSPAGRVLAEHLVSWGLTASNVCHYDVNSGRMETVMESVRTHRAS